MEKSLESINKLSFEDAQELYKDYINEKDNNKKTAIKQFFHFSLKF